jgi:hypothetical protein
MTVAAATAPLSLTGVDGLFLLAAAVAVLGGISGALAVCGGHTLPGLWRGKDGRASTSKLQAVLWTLGVVWALAAMLIAELATNHAHSALSSGWSALMGHNLQQDYIALLGIPIGTAVAAKGITTHNVSSGKVVKPDAPDDERTLRRQSLDLIGDDHGQPAVLDFQLVLFNLLLLAFFVGTFVSEPTKGLPDLPPTLLLLAGISSAGYATHKALERTTGPTITSVRPTRIALGPEPVQVEIFGGSFGEESPKTGVTIGGVTLQIANWAPDHVTAVVPTQDESRRAALPIGMASLVVHDGHGVPGEPERVEIVAGPATAATNSDEQLSPDVRAELESLLTAETSSEHDEEDRLAAAPVNGDDPGTSHLVDEQVRADDPGVV